LVLGAELVKLHSFLKATFGFILVMMGLGENSAIEDACEGNIFI
jgi:hypothetical protein